MQKIEILTLQMPKVLFNNNQITFPYKKIEALFYYIAIEKNTTRDIVSTLLWEDADTEVAKKNLRHALYMIKKTFGFDVITSVQRSKLSLNPDVEFYCDIDDLFENNKQEVYKAEFLQGFSVKNSSLFEEWMEQKRENFRNHYLIQLHNYMLNLKADKLSELEMCYSKYIETDPFDERISIILIKAYQANKLYLKGIKVYQALHDKLADELGIVPGQEITDLYKQLRIEWVESSSDEVQSEEHIIKGRSKEIDQLKKNYQQFLDGNVRAVMIDGENGVGKTYMIQNTLDSTEEDNIFRLDAHCFSGEKETPLYPWNTLVFQIEEYITKNNIQIAPSYIQVVAQFFPTFFNQPIEAPTMSLDIDNSFNFRAVQNGIFRILSQITEHTPILLVLDNFHFSDSFSRQLLALLLREINHNFMLIFTCLDTLDIEMSEFISSLQKNGSLARIHLERFSKKDIEEIIKYRLPEININEEVLDKIYEETSGNAFFLNELLANYKNKGTSFDLSYDAKNILSERFYGLSNEAKQILDIISLFHDYVTLDLLEAMLGRNSLDILDEIEELKLRSLINECFSHGIIKFSFTHNKMREFVKSRISPSKQKVLHNSIGYAIEKVSLKNDPNYYQQLVHHFTLGGNSIKAVTYQIYPFEDISINMFELYPSLFSSQEHFKTDNLFEYFNTIENNLESLKDEFANQNQYEELYTRLLLVKGRYSILSGLYPEGLISIKTSLQMDYVKNNPVYMLKSLRLMVYYGIQLYQLKLMKEYVEKGIEIAKNSENWLETALFYRLKALFHIMSRDFEECKPYLNQSINILETRIVNKRIRIINIAAAYNYLGEAERKQKKFDQAIVNYEHAISLCTQYNISINSTFYTNLGCAYEGKQNEKKAEEAFIAASELYDNSFILMGRSVAKAYCAVYSAKQGDFKKAKLYLEQANEAVIKLGSPLEKGLLRKVQAQLLNTYPKNFKNFLNEKLDFYIQDCQRLLQNFNVYELEEILI